MNRRGFLGGLAGILAAGVAPAAIGSSILMPVRKIVAPRWDDFEVIENRADPDAFYRALHERLSAYEWGQETVVLTGNEVWSSGIPVSESWRPATFVGDGAHTANLGMFTKANGYAYPNRAERRRMLRAGR